MEIKKDIEGIFNDPLLFCLYGNNKNYQGIIHNINIIVNQNYKPDLEISFYDLIYHINKTNHNKSDVQQQLEDEAIKIVLLDCFIKNEFLSLFFNIDEFKKLKDCLERKQLNSKLIHKALYIINVIINWKYDEIALDDFSKYIYLPFKSMYIDLENNYITKKHKKLKDVIDGICGISNECYLDLEKGYYDHLSNDLQEYFNNKFIGKNTMYSQWEYHWMNSKKNSYDIIEKALCDDSNVWIHKYEYSKPIITLLSSVERRNGITQAKKIIDHIYNQLLKEEKTKLLLENELPLYLSLGLEEDITNHVIRYIKSRFSKIIKSEFSLEDAQSMLYPCYNTNKDRIKKGEKIFKEFIQKAYRDNASEVLQILTNPDATLRQHSNVDTTKPLKVIDFYNNLLFGYNDENIIKKYLTLKYPNFFNNENVMARIYNTCYIMNEKLPDIINECLYEYFYYCLEMVENRCKIISTYKYDEHLREESFNQLKKLLSNYNINISDANKKMYIIALLDKKYATIDEGEQFPILEQLGDAIYNFTLDNMLFYDLDMSKMKHVAFEQYLNAKDQIKVARKIGLNKLYISSFHQSLNNKFENHDRIEEGLNHEYEEENYIADSLEMVIAAIAKEKGIQVSIDFTQRILHETFEELNIYTKSDFDYLEMVKSNYDVDYLTKIYPSRFGFDEGNEYYSNYSRLNRSLEKLVALLLLGNETKEQRKNITYISSDLFKSLNPQRKSLMINPLLSCYLYQGLDYLLKNIKL